MAHTFWKVRTSLAYWLQTLVALLSVPVLRLTLYRFGKDWRGNWFINHVAANLWADGEPVGICKFWNRYF